MKVWRSADGRVVLYLGGCLEVLPTLTGPIHACVTDPPYGLAFMGKEWDSFRPEHAHASPKRSGAGLPRFGSYARFASPEAVARLTEHRHAFQDFCLSWNVALLDVLLPGAPLLAFGGTRTWHRLGCAIEDAGFELRDTLMWLHGQGFPKSLDISKAIDKAAGAERPVVGYDASRARPNRLYEAGALGNIGGTGHVSDRTDNGATLTAPATDGAKLWDGYGTALKPAVEPVLLAMKPLSGTFAENALRHGVAGLNIDACRIAAPSGDREEYGLDGDEPSARNRNCFSPHEAPREPYVRPAAGRWPANVVHDGSAEVEAEFAKFGEHKSGGVRAGTMRGGKSYFGNHSRATEMPRIVTNSGSVSRFFYCTKSSRAERTCGGTVECKHPTVKPLALMRWLVRLVSMPGGSMILDPFMGSGTTGMAAVLEGQRFIGIEKDEESFDTAVARIEHALGQAGASAEVESSGGPEEPVDYSGVCWGEDPDEGSS